MRHVIVVTLPDDIVEAVVTRTTSITEQCPEVIGRVEAVNPVVDNRRSVIPLAVPLLPCRQVVHDTASTLNVVGIVWCQAHKKRACMSTSVIYLHPVKGRVAEAQVFWSIDGPIQAGKDEVSGGLGHLPSLGVAKDFREIQ